MDWHCTHKHKRKHVTHTLTPQLHPTPPNSTQTPPKLHPTPPNSTQLHPTPPNSTRFFNANAYEEGRGQAKAIFTLKNAADVSTAYEANLGTEIVKSLLDMCWDIDKDGTANDGASGAAFITSDVAVSQVPGQNPTFQLVPCSTGGDMGPYVAGVTSVTFFRVFDQEGEVVEQQVGSPFPNPDSSDVYGPITLVVDSSSTDATIVVLRAKITFTDPDDSQAKEVASTLRAAVTEQNTPPSAVYLNNLVVSESVSGSTGNVGTLSTADENNDQTHTYTIVGFGGPSEHLMPFAIASGSNALTFNANLNFETLFPTSSASSGTTTVTVRSTDNGTPNRYREETFTITVNNLNEAPSGVGTSTFSIDEDMSTSTGGSGVGNVVHSFGPGITDPDNGQTHSCNLVGASPFFEVRIE